MKKLGTPKTGAGYESLGMGMTTQNRLFWVYYSIVVTTGG